MFDFLKLLKGKIFSQDVINNKATEEKHESVTNIEIEDNTTFLSESVNRECDNLSYIEKGSFEVKPGTSVTIKNLKTNETEKFNVVELKYHYEPRYGSAPRGDLGYVIEAKIYDETIDILNDEISIESDFGMVIKGHKVGYKFNFRDEMFEIIEINRYVK